MKEQPSEPLGFLVCPKCKCHFCGEEDLRSHLKAFGDHNEESFKKFHSKLDAGGDDNLKPKEDIWKLGDYGYYAPAWKDPFTVKLCQQSSGWVQCGMYEYRLSQNGKWLSRRPAESR